MSKQNGPHPTHSNTAPGAAPTGARKPLTVYTVRPAEREGQKDFWTPIGIVFPHPNGEGFNIQLDALPLTAKMVCLPRREDRDTRETAA